MPDDPTENETPAVAPDDAEPAARFERAEHATMVWLDQMFGDDA